MVLKDALFLVNPINHVRYFLDRITLGERYLTEYREKYAGDYSLPEPLYEEDLYRPEPGYVSKEEGDRAKERILNYLHILDRTLRNFHLLV